MRKHIAKAAYRATWENYLLRRCRDERRQLEELMDELQSYCVVPPNPGPEWDEFVATLPGFNAYWERFHTSCKEAIDRMEKK